MKNKILIPIAGMFALALAFNFGGSTESFEKPMVFLESDNIAYADTGYTCAPSCYTCGCPIPGGTGGGAMIWQYTKQ